MRDEKEWLEMKRSDGRQKGVIGDEEMRDEKKWWEVNRKEKEIMGNEKM